MYGLLVENLASFIRIQWGEGKWDMVRKHTGVDAPSFSIHHVYPETLLNKLAKSALQVLGCDEKQFYEAMGIYFVEYVGQYGYDKMLTVLGRHMRDFLNGLDNLHEYLKFSYTKMRAPSFYCDSESATGLRLHYRSRRRGFVYYVMGQIKQVGKHFYNQDIEIEILSEKLDGETMHTIFQLNFDNDAFSEAESIKSMIRMEQQLPIRASIIFELFPFCIVFTPEMEIKFTGHALLTILRDLVGQCMTEAFELVKPMISFCFDTILERRNNIFELITAAPIKDDEALTGSCSFDNESDDEAGTSLKLRGQMMHMEEWNMILFLANPVMPDLTSLVEAGLYINDLSLHDCSRDLVLAGTQQSVELKLALDQEQQKSKKLEESMKKLDEEMKRTDELLYQMIPKQIADRLRTGESPVDTCEVFESVSILFSDVVTFTDICSRITPMQVVCMLNHMYSLFDQLTERNGVYKVETIGDSYMVVSGAPDADASHSERIADMAMDMVDATQAIIDPSRESEALKIRVGCHSGMVVAGVVGVKMPRYCLFGDAVNTASRMESTSEGGRIQISEKCMERLPVMYNTEKRGVVTVKGKGEMATYWLTGRENRVPLSRTNTKSFNWTAPVPSAGALLKTQMTQQMSVMSEDASKDGKEPEGTEDKPGAADLVKDEGVKGPETDKQDKKRFVRQQPAIDASSLDSSSSFKIEPKSSFNKPIEIKGDAGQTNKKMFKPIMENLSAFARQNSVAASTTISGNPTANPPVLKPVQEDQPKTSRALSPTIRTISPNPDLPAWENVPQRKKSATPNLVSANSVEFNPPQQSLGIPQNLGDNSTRRPSTPRISESVTGAKIIEWVQEPIPSDLPKPVAKPAAADVPQQIIQPAIAEVPNKKVAEPENVPSLPNGQVEGYLLQKSENLLSPNDIRPEQNGPPQLLLPEPLDSDDNEQYGINFERRKSRIFEGINGIRKGSQQFRSKIKDKNLSTVTVEAMADMGCNEFASKQKEIISKACVLL